MSWFNASHSIYLAFLPFRFLQILIKQLVSSVAQGHKSLTVIVAGIDVA